MIVKKFKTLSKCPQIFYPLVVITLSGCSTLPDDMCDPADDSFLKSFQCKSQYENRQKNLREEVRIASINSSGKELDLEALQKRQDEQETTLNQMQTQLNRQQKRIDEIRKSNSSSKSAVLKLQAKWNDIQQETNELKILRARVQSQQQAGELANQIDLLRKREAELEILLLDLES